MVVDVEKQSKSPVDHAGLKVSGERVAQPLNTYQVHIRRLEPFLLLFLMAQGMLILAANGNPPRLLVVAGLLGLSLISIYWRGHSSQTALLLRACFATVIVGYLCVTAVDPTHALLAWFYLLIVFYSFALSPPYQYLVILFVPLTFTLASVVVPGTGGMSEFIARMSLMLLLGLLMGFLRNVAQRSYTERVLLTDELRQARDDYARQLDERTAELKSEIQERKQIEARLVEERQLLQTVIDTFPSRLFVKDRDSRFTLVNRASLIRFGLEDEPDAVIGKSDFDFYPHFAERTYNDEQRLMETGEPIIDLEETTVDNEGIERHYLISKMPMYHSETREIVGLVGVTTEITSLKEAQIALRKSEESLKLFQLRLKALNQIAINLTRIESFDELTYQSIKQAIDHLGFRRLSCWFTQPDEPKVLVGAYRVNEHGDIVSSQHQKMTLHETHPAYKLIQGIETNYVIRDAPLYNVEFEPIGTGDKAFTTLLDGIKVIGCLYTDTLLDETPLSQSQIELLNLYGATLGGLFNRQRAQEALQASEEAALQFQQQLKRLNEVTIKLEATDSLDELCRQVVILGREQLGFERLGIWLSDEENPAYRRGMWGTGPDGQLIDERQLVTRVPDNEATMVSEGEIIALSDHAIYTNDESTVLGYGWTLIGLMWDGTKRIGWLYGDNLLDGQPLTSNRYELFRLYAATIGLLCGRRIADDRLRQSEIRYRAITEASSDVIAIVNQALVVTYISPSLRTVMGVHPQSVIGRHVTEVIHPEDEVEASRILQHCVQQPRLSARMNEFRVRHAKGHWVHMEAVMTSLIDDPVIKGVVISCRDLTQRLIAEERKRIVERERERAAVLRQFISDISHDFRTPLSTISTNAYLLKNGRTDNIQERTEMIDQQVDRLSDLISNLNTITKLDEVTQIPMEKVDINTIINAIPHDRTRVMESKQLDLRLDLQRPLPKITGNVELLNEAIFHLMDNAIQFSHAGGAITIESYTEQEWVVVTLKDDGIGIAQEDLPFIFDRLYRADKARSTHTGGSGLGLAITRRIVELHEGTIDISSQLHQGTQVQLCFPCESRATTPDTY